MHDRCPGRSGFDIGQFGPSGADGLEVIGGESMSVCLVPLM